MLQSVLFIYASPIVLTEHLLDTLEQLMAQVLAKEDYESATKFRDAMKNTQKQRTENDSIKGRGRLMPHLSQD